MQLPDLLETLTDWSKGLNNEQKRRIVITVDLLSQPTANTTILFPEDRAAAALVILAEKGRINSRSLARASGVSRETARATLKRMATHGEVRKVGNYRNTWYVQNEKRTE